jgi:hypothetical protein
MTSISPSDLGSILAEGIKDQDVDTLWWVVDELQGKHENITA